MKPCALLIGAVLIACAPAGAPQTAPEQSEPKVYTRADTLRGDWTTPGRSWWDVTFYDLHVAIDPSDSTIRGYNGITYRVIEPGRELQIDLMTPLVLDSVVQNGRALPLRQEGNAWFAATADDAGTGAVRTATAFYHGRPRTAERPPWEGGFTWASDSAGRPWIVTTDQGIGASIWWPNKDTQAEEPDSQRIALTVPDPLVAVANGRLRSTTPNGDGTTTYEWFVTSPINNYGIAVNAGHYTHWSDTLQGEKGALTLDFWPHEQHLAAARRQWTQVKPSLQCLEHWFGPYPWYEDGYKLIDVPYNGMEHQSAVTYGNGFENGYRGRDASGTGLGMKWDFIILHESAHEWFANAVTAKDQADMWVHESFANYAEGLYTECLFGKEAGAEYIIGTRRGIKNDVPLQPVERGVNAHGSGDMYPKGGNMLHTVRQLVGNDEKWRGILRGLVATFGRRTVLGSEIEEYIERESGVELTAVFDQYLRDVRIPALEYRIAAGALHYRWAEVVPGFAMPVEVSLPGGAATVLRPSSEWQTIGLEQTATAGFTLDPDYYVTVREVGTALSAPPASE
ncbi:MAG: M1 family metallopeptidase [Gemmatimonadota bacterium]|nr:M1 family metallopeptidase [Gemmatimonadota bacterium]